MYFQQELIKKVLIESGIITASDIERAVLEQKKLIKEGQKKISLSSLFFNQKDYGYRARIRNHGHSCFLCEIVIRSQFHTTYEPEA
jgi:hypothetical protein